MPKPLKTAALTLALLLLLPACATAPAAPPICPEPPPSIARERTDVDYLGMMRLFLQGTLPPLPDSKPPSEPATPSLSR